MSPLLWHLLLHFGQLALGPQGGQVPLLTGKKSGGEWCSLHTGGDGASWGEGEHTAG